MNVVRDAAVPEDGSAAIRARVAENMRRTRLTRGLSLRDLAAATGLSKALMSQVERGIANPTVATLALIAGALDLSFAELVVPPGPMSFSEISGLRTSTWKEARGLRVDSILPIFVNLNSKFRSSLKNVEIIDSVPWRQLWHIAFPSNHTIMRSE